MIPALLISATTYRLKDLTKNCSLKKNYRKRNFKEFTDYFRGALLLQKEYFMGRSLLVTPVSKTSKEGRELERFF